MNTVKIINSLRGKEQQKQWFPLNSNRHFASIFLKVCCFEFCRSFFIGKTENSFEILFELYMYRISRENIPNYTWITVTLTLTSECKPAMFFSDLSRQKFHNVWFLVKEAPTKAVSLLAVHLPRTKMPSKHHQGIRTQQVSKTHA